MTDPLFSPPVAGARLACDTLPMARDPLLTAPEALPAAPEPLPTAAEVRALAPLGGAEPLLLPEPAEALVPKTRTGALKSTAQARASTTPEAVRPWRRWKSTTAPRVCGP